MRQPKLSLSLFSLLLSQTNRSRANLLYYAQQHTHTLNPPPFFLSLSPLLMFITQRRRGMGKKKEKILFFFPSLIKVYIPTVGILSEIYKNYFKYERKR